MSPAPHDLDLVVTSAELVDELGITYRQLDYWCRSGLLAGMPSDTGHGIRRLFNRKQAATVRAASQLIQAGFTPRAAARLANLLELTGETTATVWVDHLRVEVTLNQPLEGQAA